MLKTRDDVKNYAIKICLAMLERTANRRVERKIPVVIDELGFVPTFLEEFCRPIWGLAPVIQEMEGDFMLHVQGEEIALCDWIRTVLIEGVDPESPYAWDTYRECVGNHPFAFQNLTELAGLLIGMFFARKKIWDPIPEQQKRRIADWIYDCCVPECEHIAGNNHVWFPMFCLLVLKKFGFDYPRTEEFLRAGMEKLDTMYISDGWYQDGDFGRFDYYTAWSMHSYPLMWCLIEDESLDGYGEWRQRYMERTEKFLPHYLHWFDCNGAHAPFGRSLAYRFAASCVFPLAVLCGCRVDPAVAREVTLRNISYFEKNAQLTEDGVLPAGYLYDSAALVENYTSDGGAYWCTKTFLCLLMPKDHPFWAKKEADLPIDRGEYLVRPQVEKIRLAVGGTKESGVTIYNNVCQYYQFGRYCNPFQDMASYYDKFAYNSRAGFAISTRDRTSYDNMIGLMTEDQSMHSHRWGFVDRGEQEGAFLSTHVPFSNDPHSLIATALLPLPHGYHVRLHRVKISQPYLVREGGFCVGQWDDYCRKETGPAGCSIANHTLISVFHAVSDTALEFSIERPQPGLHLLSPQAGYPCYTTQLLTPGIYTFAVVCGIFDQDAKIAKTLPRLTLQNGDLQIDFLQERRQLSADVLDQWIGK